MGWVTTFTLLPSLSKHSRVPLAYNYNPAALLAELKATDKDQGH